MSRNTSSAVMAQRKEPNDSLDLFPTPLWSTRALCEHVLDIRGKTVWEPACGQGHMSRALAEYAEFVHESDVHPYDDYTLIHDFLQPYLPVSLSKAQVDWVITNPPFRLALEFIERGLEIARLGVAVIVRTNFLESQMRYKRLFKDRPPSIVAQFAERNPMFKGRLDEGGSSATAYCWAVWYREPAWHGCRLQWIKPCRKQLERPGDWLDMKA